MPELIQLRTRAPVTATPTTASPAVVRSGVLDTPALQVTDEEDGLFVTQYLYRHKLLSDTWLLCNTLTGAVDVVDNRIAQILTPRARVDPSRLAPDELRTLTARGYLLNRRNERARVANWFADFKERMRSLHFIVCPTFTCNLRCPYCYEDLEIRQSRSAVSPTQVDHMFEAMRRFVDERGARDVLVEFFGGEPFLRANRHTVALIADRAADQGWKISGITNGTQIDSYFSIFERHSTSITQIQVTMDGPQEIHDRLRINANGSGSYDAICRNVLGLLERGIPVALRINTGTDNVEHLPRLFSEFERMGWTRYPMFQCQIAPVNDHACTGCVSNYQPEFKLLRQLYALFDDWEETRDRYHITLGYDLERRTSLLRFALFGKRSPAVRSQDLSGCSASNQHYVVFGADGCLYACPETVGVPSAAIGRYSPDFDLDRARWSKWDLNISNTPKCVGCNIAPVCGGACPWHGFNASGFDAYEPHCNYAQQTIATYLDLNRKRILQALGLDDEVLKGSGSGAADTRESMASSSGCQ